MNDTIKIIIGIMIPFIGTALGAAGVLLPVKRNGASSSRFAGTGSKIMSGFSAGVMIASSVWSLLIPSLELSASAKIPWLPAVVGFFIGTAFLFVFDSLLDRFEGVETSGSVFGSFSVRTFGAVTLHNIPEGIAVGIAMAGAFFGATDLTDGTALTAAGTVSLAGAISLSLGIAIQNIPEGAIISVPLCINGMKRSRALLLGILSGAVEPAASVTALLLTSVFIPRQPYLLSFAAGAMFYVSVTELIPDGCGGEKGKYGAAGFVFGFLLMMALDTALG